MEVLNVRLGGSVRFASRRRPQRICSHHATGSAEDVVMHQSGFDGHSDLLPLVSTLRKSEPPIGRLVVERSVPAGTVLMTEDAVGQQAFLIVDGWAVVTAGDRVLAELGPGEIVGEMAMLDQDRRAATAIATTPTRLLVIGPSAFSVLASRAPVVSAIADTLSRRLRALIGREKAAHAGR